MSWMKSIFSSKSVTAEYGDTPKVVDFNKALIGNAIDKQHEITFLYKGKKDLQSKERRVIPSKVEGPLARAFCLDTNVWKHFNVGNIEGKITSSKPRSIEPPEDIEEESSERPTFNSENAPSRAVQPVNGYGSTAPLMYPPSSSGHQMTVKQIELLPVEQRPQPGKDIDANQGNVDRFIAKHSNDDTPTLAVRPTNDEYKEIRSLDIDPDTHDKATYRRIRSIGASHKDCVEAARAGIPMEDYELALQNNNGDAKAAHEESLKYQGFYDHLINKNKQAAVELNQSDPRTNPLKQVSPLSDEEHDNLVGDLFEHHFTLRNEPEHRGAYVDVPGRRRANEWIMSELTKLTPSLKRGLSRKLTRYDDSKLLPASHTNFIGDDKLAPNDMPYDQIVNKLITHYTHKNMLPQTRRDYIVNSRKLNALSNIANSKWYPNDYTADRYEEND